MKDSFFTFEDLEFIQKYPESSFINNIMQAKMFFPNGYGVSVVYGDWYYSDNELGIQTYELMGFAPTGVFYHNDPLRYLTMDEVTDEMIKLQKKGTVERRFTEDDPYGEEQWDD